LRAAPGIVSVLPVIDGQVLLTSEGGGFRGGLVRGVSQADLKALPIIGDHIVAGSLNDFTGDDAVAVGVSLAESFRLGIGSLITLTSPKGAATVIGTVPRIRAFKVVAIFDSGLYDYNSNVVFLPLPMAQIFFQMPNAINEVQLRVADPEHFESVLPSVRAALDGRQVLLRDWRHANDQIIGVLQVQKDTMFIVLGMIILVAAFNVISSLIMLVKDKRADIAVLRTLGAGSGAILRIFLMCGAFVGVSGTAIGTLIGIVFCRNIVAIQHLVERISGGEVFDSSVFMLTALPSSVDWDGVVRVVILGLSLSLLATLYPSWRAARTDPVEVLRSG
jgi:lipoprotein-releasing system permease protein